MNQEQTNPELAAQPRDTSRRLWLTHAGQLAGLALVGGVATRASAQAPTSPDAAAVPSTDANPNNPAKTIPKSAQKVSPSDIDILNFALGLEYLEADFYARVVQAHQTRAFLTPRVFAVAQKLAADEAAHVQAILDILGRAEATPVAKPQFQFPNNAFYSPVAFLDLATTLEETGVGAYLGAAPKIQSRDALKFAASVYGIEARHTGLIRMLSGRIAAPVAIEQPLSVEEVTRRVAPFIVG